MGRSRGGLTPKFHALVDANGLPIALELSEGQAHDGRSAKDMLAGLGRGQILLADRAYDSDALRTDLAARGAWTNIKPMPGRKLTPRSAGFSTAIAISSSGSSTNSSTSAPSPRALKNTMPTISPSSNLHPSASGCGFMSRCPRTMSPVFGAKMRKNKSSEPVPLNRNRLGTKPPVKACAQDTAMQALIRIHRFSR